LPVSLASIAPGMGYDPAGPNSSAVRRVISSAVTVRLGVTRRYESGIGLGCAADVIWSSSVGALVSLL